MMTVFAKQILQKKKPDLIVVAGGWGKTMAADASATALRTLQPGLALLAEVSDMAKSLVTLNQGSLLASLWRNVLRGEAYPQTIFLEIAEHTIWLNQESLAFAGRIVLLLPTVPSHVSVKEYVQSLFKQFGDQAKRVEVVFNADIAGLADAIAEQGLSKQITFGINQVSDFQANFIDVLPQEPGQPNDGRWRGMGSKVQAEGSTVPLLLFGGIGRQHVYAGLAALALSKAFGLNAVEASQALRTRPPLPGRMVMIPGIKKSMLIDDSYDTDAESLVTALQDVAALPLEKGKKRLAVIGEIADLGADSADVHGAVGALIASLPYDMVIAIGERCHDLLAGAHQAGMPESKLFHFIDKDEAGKFVQHELRKGELVLIKGAAKDKLETVVKELMAFPLKAKQDLLVR